MNSGVGSDVSSIWIPTLSAVHNFLLLIIMDNFGLIRIFIPGFYLLISLNLIQAASFPIFILRQLYDYLQIRVRKSLSLAPFTQLAASALANITNYELLITSLA